jgi:putative membrane protein
MTLDRQREPHIASVPYLGYVSERNQRAAFQPMRASRGGPHNGSMTNPLLIPLEGGFGHHHHHHHHHGPPSGAGEPSATFASGALPPFVPSLGALMFFLFLLLALGTLLFFLIRNGQFGPSQLTADRSPEAEAKRILAERFARGDITSDEFMERASILNWTPGSDSWEIRKGKKRR